MDKQLLLDKFDFMSRLPDDERRHLLNSVVYREIPAGTLMISENTSCAGVTFVLSGEIKIFKLSESGREITLYNVKGGETCVLTVACLLGLNRSLSPVSAVTLQQTQIAVMPADTFRYLYSVSPYIQQFVFQNVLDKFYNMIDLVEKLTFKSVTQRLIEYMIVNSSFGKKPLYITHAQLAARLGTSREVVTRKLKMLEADGFIRAERGKITVLKNQYLPDLK